MNGRAGTPADLTALLRNIDQEITETLQVYGDGLKVTADDTHQEIGRHICFDLGDKKLALPLSLVDEVGELENVRQLPFLPDWVHGVTNIRGEIVSVTDLPLFFHLTQKKSRKKNRVAIVIHDGEMKTAIIVDRITATRMLYTKHNAEQEKQEQDAVLSRFLTGPAVYFSGEKEEEVQLFDGEQLLSSIRI
ncbi:MAG: chemotaxis protein CheW [Candidatus Electrothrix aestuarii]|uniref:Chemotaxis protein CheW n=1 Tax=Candidatus Electrothrix aestuarii TaxID=3062594 RepID=A0AAU8LU13_9BACT